MRLDREARPQDGVHAILLERLSAALDHRDPRIIGVAVSGGGDSMALLYAALHWSRGKSCTVQAVTVDHCLRAQAAQEAADVAAFCHARDIAHSTLRWDGTRAHGNVQAAGRDARYTLIARWAKSRGIQHILLGHTADDVAETFLMRLARKSGVDGLAAMAPMFQRNGVAWHRPFLNQSRASLRAYLRARQINWVDDPSNEDLTQTRPQARQILQALAPLGIDQGALAQTAQALAQARDALQTQAIAAAETCVTIEAGDVMIDAALLMTLPFEIMRRLQIAALRSISGARYGPRETAISRLNEALTTQDQYTILGCLVRKHGGALRYGRELNAVEGPVQWADRSVEKRWDHRWLLSRETAENTRGALIIRALGADLKDVPDWRALGIPRATLMASPSVWRGGVMMAAPIAGISNGFRAQPATDFTSFLLSR